ncbi:MAG TPA: phage tail tip lysozyme [Streptosporangiaceae bacterium]|jgi:hypothetical protein
MGVAAEHGRKRKVRKSGRHTAPSQVEKVARAAGRAAPAVAVLGALAAAPQFLGHADASTTHGHQAVAAALYPDRVGGVGSAVSPEWYKTTTYRPQRKVALHGRHATAASPGTAGLGVPHHPVHYAKHRAPQPTAPVADTCTPHQGAAGSLPENYAQIVDYLGGHGYTGLAAAGIAGNIYQESGGDPESGGGLIGWTPLPAGYVTGDPTADLATQLAGILSFNQVWAQYIPELNDATSAAAAADVYMTYFERPSAPAQSRREAAATAVAAACGL